MVSPEVTDVQPSRCMVRGMPRKKRGEKLTGVQVAERLGIKPSSWRGMVTRGEQARAQGKTTPGLAPAADGMLDGRTPFWWESTIEEFQARRPGHGWRSGSVK